MVSGSQPVQETRSSKSIRVPSLILVIVFLTLALSIVALIFAVNAFDYGQEVTAGYLLLIGCLGLGLSTYVLFQTRRRMSKLSIEVSPVTTTIECQKCGFKNLRKFQRGDYVFKELEECQKCNEKMLITAIYRDNKNH